MIEGPSEGAKAGASPARRLLPIEQKKHPSAMKLLKTLTNPFLLGAQGFVAGAVIFFATHPDAGPQRDAPSAQHAKAETARTRA